MTVKLVVKWVVGFALGFLRGVAFAWWVEQIARLAARREVLELAGVDTRPGGVAGFIRSMRLYIEGDVVRDEPTS